MGKGIVYTRLTPDTAADLRVMNALFAAVFDDADTYLSAPPDDQAARSLLQNPHVICAIARDGAACVGAIAGYILPKFEQPRSEGYIYDLAVAATHRRQGIATGLIRLFQTEAAQNGAWVTYVQADLTDPPAIALYDKLGRREAVLHYDLDFPPIPQG